MHFSLPTIVKMIMTIIVIIVVHQVLIKLIQKKELKQNKLATL